MPGKITNIGNTEDLISQFMLENDPAAQVEDLKNEVKETEAKVEEAKALVDKPKDTTIKVQKVEDLEDLFKDEEDSNDTSDTEDKPDTTTDTSNSSTDSKVTSTVDTTKDSTEDYAYANFISYLAEKGILDLDEDEDTVEDSEDALVESVQKTINKQVESYKQSIPTVGKEFLDYIDKGGDPTKFLTALSSPIDYSTIDTANEADQELVVKEYLKTQDYTQDEIKETIEGFKDGLLLEKQAKIAKSKLVKQTEQQRQYAIKEAEQELEQKKQAQQKYISDLTNTIKQASSLAGLEIRDKDKDDFQRWLLQPGKDGLTGYQREVQENPIQTQIDLAYLKYRKFDYSKVAKQAETKATLNIKRKLNTTTNTNPKGSTGSNLNGSEDTKASNGVAGFRGFLK